MADCGAVLQKHRNLCLFSNIPAEHRHRPFELAVQNRMCGRCLRGACVSRCGRTHVLNMETLDAGLRHRAARQRLAPDEATRTRRKRHCMCAWETRFQPGGCIWCPLCKMFWRPNPPAERVHNGSSSAPRVCRKGAGTGFLHRKGGAQVVHKRVQKGCRKGPRTPLPSRGVGVENVGKWTISGNSENQPPNDT